MLKNKFVLALFSMVLLINACDIVEAPYEENGNTNIDTTAKVVLIEEYTGSRCGNCPPAGEIAHKIKEKFPNNVVLLSIHAGQLATPTPKYPYKWISKVMDELEKYYNIGWGLGTPNGLVDRSEYNKQTILPKTDWESAAIERMKVPASIKIELSPSFNAGTKTITCKAKMKFLSDAPTSYNLALYVVEDSIVGHQTYYGHDPVEMNDFVHNNIIRDALTSTFGNQISTTPVKKDSEISMEFSKAIPDGSDWRPQWIRIVAIVTNPDNKHEVIQCGEKYILK